MKPVDPDLEWQAGVLAAKVLKRLMSLDAAAAELDAWQAAASAEAAGNPADKAGAAGANKTDAASRYRAVESRALIVTHALNALIKRGY